MIYVIVLVIYMVVNVVLQNLADIAFDKGKYALANMLDNIKNFCTFAWLVWLIYELAIYLLNNML